MNINCLPILDSVNDIRYGHIVTSMNLQLSNEMLEMFLGSQDP